VADASAGSAPLLAAIRGMIRAEGPVTFARFMDEALYHPQEGYYARGPARLGRDGDFYTASDVGPAFGRALARQIAEIDDRLSRPDPFRYVEFACGRGLLARDVLDAAAGRASGSTSRWRATLVDSSPAMRAAAASLVTEAEVVPPEAVTTYGAGCVVAVELLDALPVHRVVRREGRLKELGVGLSGDDLCEVVLAPSAEVVAWAERYGAAPEEGDEAEVSLGLEAAVLRLATSIERGVVLVVDYGDVAAKLYDRGRRRGTLLAYHRHGTSEDYLRRVGEQDLTAHVNFTALVDAARAAGLYVLGTTTQDRFLIANGILDGLDSGGTNDLAAVKARLQAKQLIHPGGMGRIFKVALFAKGPLAGPSLAGLADPFGGGPPRGGTDPSTV
jgi:SAM-dependent MidA family methyltransferase